MMQGIYGCDLLYHIGACDFKDGVGMAGRGAWGRGTVIAG
jgi:hypothetical protein